MPAMTLNRNIVLLIAGIFAFTSCKKEPLVTGFFDENVLSISTFIEKNKEEYSKYWQILQSTDLYHTLNAFNPLGEGFTLFLPTDVAFERYIGQSEKYSDFESLLADKNFIRLLSRYHLVNTSLMTTDFPYGALPDTTASGDYLTIGVEVVGDSTSYMVNNAAPVVVYDIETANGYIQVIDEVLEPISFNSYDWLIYKGDYSILAQAFEYSGLKDTMDIYRRTSSGQIIKNGYTLLAEHDSIFIRNGIHSFEDLVSKYHTPGYDLDDPEGGLYQFAAYHLLEGRYFLDAFEGSSNYNSYAVYPVTIGVGIDIRINTGVEIFREEIIGTDTVPINYIGIFYQESNVNTKNGPIHFIDQVMELYKPATSVRTFQFLEDPLIKESEKVEGTYEFVDQKLFELIWWSGSESLIYFKGSGSERASNDDYIQLDDNFKFSYVIPKIMPGKYQVELQADAYNSNNATIRVWIDGKRIGGNLNLTSGGRSTNPYEEFTIGIAEFTSYEEHILEISSLIPGIMRLDYVRFIPE